MSTQAKDIADPLDKEFLDSVTKFLDLFKILNTSAVWQKKHGHVIMDADGWDRMNYQFSFHEELITEKEYFNRLQKSTIMIQRGKNRFPDNEYKVK
jgi:hypothetical protein